MKLQFVNRMGMCLMLLFSIASGALADPPAGDWTLIWSDEFTSGSTPEYPNSTYWGYENGYVRNKEWQYYTNSIQNAYCQDGFLHIEAHKHPAGTYPTGSETGQDGSISSASLCSMNKVEGRYGWLEMRARIDTQLGSWPAFWTLGRSGQWPDSGECDIMEYYTGNLHFNVAWWKTGDAAWTARWDGVAVPVSSLGSGWVNDFHLWVMEWTPEVVRLYMDGVLYNTWDASQDSGDSSVEGFQQSHYILLNQAIGGTAGGNASGLVYPTNYEIDYVRWYQGTSVPPTGNIAIVNSSFEEPGLVKCTNWESVPGWSSDTVAADSGVESGGTNGAWQGYLMGSDPAVWQLTDHVLSAGETLTLTVDATATAGATALTMTLYYDNAGSRVAAATQQVPLTSGWQEFTLTFNADAVPAAIGKRIGILLDNPSSAANWLGIDSVTFSTTSGEIDTTPPAAPTGLTATAGDGSVTLNWADNSEPDLMHYDVYRSATSGSGYVSIISGQTTSDYVDNSVTNGTTYYYVVTATDTSANESGNSNESSAAPQGCVSTASHVESIVCTTASGSRGQKYGQVMVTIYDNCGLPVSGADVTGTFTGTYNQSVSGTTNAGGTVVLTTTAQVKKPHYTFCVDDVVSGLTYDAAANTVTCGSY
jgi:beta-glucanase (GH16 family)